MINFNFVSFLIVIYFAQDATAARILAVIPTASYSHQMFYQQLWRELALRGHDMVVITTDPTNEKLPNFREIDIKESYGPWKEVMDMFIEETMMALMLGNKIMASWVKCAWYQMNLPQVREIIDNHTEHFDLMMVEHFGSPILGLKHRYKCPLIGVVSMDGMTHSHVLMGNPVHSVLYPSSMLPFQENLTFIQRIVALVFTKIFENNMLWSIGEFDKMMKQLFGEDTPNIMDIFEETDMLFVNANPLFTPLRPHTPSTISLAGGIHMKPQKPLPTDIKEFLDNAKEGAIYFSLGGNVKSNELPRELLEVFIETLANVPYKVLWKFEDDTLPGKPENVIISKWAPQQDVLRHPNLKLFITQGGLQSLEEALYSHVPMIVIPFMGDQEANAAKVKSKQLGVVLDRYNLNSNELRATIKEVIENPTYKNNVVSLAMQIQDEPMTSLEKAVWWTEYVLRNNGAKHLKGPKIPTYQYYYLDITAFLVIMLLIIIGLLYGIVKLIGRCIQYTCGSQSKTKPKKSKRE